MAVHLDVDDPRYSEAAAEMLRRHDRAEPEANITSAVRNFLTLTGLARDEEIVEEQAPAQGSHSAVDLTALDTFIEVKRRIGTTGGFNPNPEHVAQLDDYLDQSEQAGHRSRMGILTDGKYWLLRWPRRRPRPDGPAVWLHPRKQGSLAGPPRMAAGPGARLQREHPPARPRERRGALQPQESALRKGHYPPAGAVPAAQGQRDGAGEAAAVGQPAAGGAGGSGGHAAGAGRPVRAAYLPDGRDRPGGAGDVRH